MDPNDQKANYSGDFTNMSRLTDMSRFEVSRLTDMPPWTTLRQIIGPKRLRAENVLSTRWKPRATQLLFGEKSYHSTE